eukprot:339312_1
MAFNAWKDPYLITIIWMGICIVFTVIIFLHTFLHLCIKDSSEWISKTYKNLTLLTMIASILVIIGEFTFYLTPKQIPMPQYKVIMLVSIDAVYFFGNILFYTLILLRISVPFKLNQVVFYTLLSVILLFGIAAILYCIELYDTLSYNINEKFFHILLWILSSCDLMLNGFIMILFAYKTRKTIIGLDPFMSDEAEYQRNLLSHVMTKHCVLFGIAIVVNQSFFVVQLLYDFCHFGSYVIATVLSLEVTTNVFILWLILRINYNWYGCVCKCCHICVGRTCFKTSTELENPYRVLNSLL